jgi:hypothetical protein
VKRRIMSVQVEVPDSARMLVAVRHIPDWATITESNLATFAHGYPAWSYFTAGEQASRSLFPGSRLVRSAVVDRW